MTPKSILQESGQSIIRQVEDISRGLNDTGGGHIDTMSCYEANQIQKEGKEILHRSTFQKFNLRNTCSTNAIPLAVEKYSNC